jgi:hypothetical protein
MFSEATILQYKLYANLSCVSQVSFWAVLAKADPLGNTQIYWEIYGSNGRYLDMRVLW